MINFTNADGQPFVDPRAAAFRAVVDRLKSDGVLSVHVKKWKAIPITPIDLTLADLPYVIISLAAGPISVASPNSHSNSLNIGIKYAVDASGFNEETAWLDVLNLYGQIEMAISPFEDAAWLRDPIKAADSTAIFEGMTFTKAGFTTIPVAGVDAIQADCVLSVALKLKPCRRT